MKAKMLSAALAALLTTTGAQAAIVSFSTAISVPNNVSGVYVNLLTGATGTSSTATTGWDFNPYNSGTNLSFFWPSTPTASSGGVASTTTGPYLDLAAGAVISSASTFATTTANAQTAAFRTTGSHILGFRFFNESTSAINYGYLTLSTTATTGFPATITGWSFENSGGAITVPGAGAIPEPASWLMMIAGFGLTGVALRARRQDARVSFG